MKNYEHSTSFHILKNIKEELTNNYTSLQYLQTLDFFLWKALEPIAAECPSLFYNYLTKVVARQSLKSSAKFTSGERHKLPIQLFNSLVSKSPTKAFESSKLLYINRGLLFGFISMFRNKLRYYEELSRGHHNISAPERSTVLHRIELSLGLRPFGSLYAALLQVVYWDNKARDFKRLIVEKYTRMALLQAQKAYEDYNYFVPLDDVVQVYLLVVSKAIDRCDARQGVLTTFIQNWFKSARGEIAKLAEGRTDQSYESLAEDLGDAAHEALGVTLPDLSMELQEHIAYVAKQVDLQGLVRTALGIPQFVTRAQLETLKEFVYEGHEEDE
jgi:hypothetical protein